MKFKIQYRDPTDEDSWLTKYVEFSFAGGIPARQWAEDYAYALADKGEYVIEKCAGTEEEG